MGKHYKILVETKMEAIHTIVSLIDHGYLFFDKLRLSKIDEIIKHLDRYGDDGTGYVKVILTGYSDCERIFGCSRGLTERDDIFGGSLLYTEVSLEEFLKIKGHINL